MTYLKRLSCCLIGISMASTAQAQFSTSGAAPSFNLGGSVQRFVAPQAQVLLEQGDLSRWTDRLSINAPRNVTFRIGSPLSSGTLSWAVLLNGARIAEGHVPEYAAAVTADPEAWFELTVPAASALANYATTNDGTEFQFVFTVTAENGATLDTQAIAVTLIHDGTATFFETQMSVYQEIYSDQILEPFRLFSSFGPFEILKQDESSGDEPYILPFVIPIDGSRILLNDLPQSRLEIFSKGPTHGNIPRPHGSFEEGESTFIDDAISHYEFPFQMMGAREFRPDLPQFGGSYFVLGEVSSKPELASKTLVLVGAIFAEEDNTATSTIDQVRDAVIDAMQSTLNDCLRSLGFFQVIALSESGIDGLPCISKAEYEELEIRTPYERARFTEFLEAKMEALARDIAIIEELDNATALLLPTGPVATLLSAIDPDDIMGFQYALIDLRSLLIEGRPIHVVLDNEYWTRPAVDFSAVGTPASLTAKYRLGVTVGRCEQVQPRAGGKQCKPYIHQSYKYAKRPFPPLERCADGRDALPPTQRDVEKWASLERERPCQP